MPGDEKLVVTAIARAERSAQLLELLTVADVAAILKVSRSWVYEQTRSRATPRADRLPHVKIGKYVRFDPQLVRAFLDRRTSGR